MGCSWPCRRSHRGFDSTFVGKARSLKQDELRGLSINALRFRLRQLGEPRTAVEAMSFRSLADTVLLRNVLGSLRCGDKSDRAVALRVLRDKDVHIARDALQSTLEVVGVPAEERGALGSKSASKLLHRKLVESALRASSGFLLHSDRLLLQGALREWLSVVTIGHDESPVGKGKDAPGLEEVACVSLADVPAALLLGKYSDLNKLDLTRIGRSAKITGVAKTDGVVTACSSTAVKSTVTEAEADLDDLLGGEDFVGETQFSIGALMLNSSRPDPQDVAVQAEVQPSEPAGHSGACCIHPKLESASSKWSSRNLKFEGLDAELSVCLKSSDEAARYTCREGRALPSRTISRDKAPL
eukprot:TRINITY_DN27120_c0_g1_i1.p1 TRINITY_DN27120_c0_g1~~TRINITY_DN27120_c0_g1_i1.p1  ORF type:complete len:356 (-),score=54.59 TRINITY_DN27120_c0_g1_i1:20-1087(-)